MSSPENTHFKLEPFFELSPDLFCIAGFDGYFKLINSAVSNLLGYTPEELYSRPINDFIYHDDKDITSMYRDNLKKNIPLLNFENRYSTKTSEIVWLSWTSIPVDSEQLVYAIGRNVTHKKKVEEERNLLLTNLTRINKDLKQITYSTSHNLRTPVNNLLLVFHLLDVSTIHDEETLEFVEILKTATAGLKDTLDSYVDALSEKDTLNIHTEELDLKDILDKTLQSILSLIHNSKAEISTDFSEAETIRFNKNYLESIFLNLITNSIKYAKPDSHPQISISTKKIGGIVQIIFTDNGLGFDMEKVKDRIFGLHQKFHNHIDSKGIGLYLIYNHVTSLGGSITVESEVDKGATFVISLKN